MTMLAHTFRQRIADRTRNRIRSLAIGAGACMFGLGFASPVSADDFILIRDTLDIEVIDLVEINASELIYNHPKRGWQSIDVDHCLAIIDPRRYEGRDRGGRVILADGQRLPGRSQVAAATQQEFLAWNHPWLDRIELQIDELSAVQFSTHAPIPDAGEADVVRLLNNDVIHGFILGLGDPVSIEVENAIDPNAEPDVMTIGQDRIAAIKLASVEAPKRGQSVWFHDGTILALERVVIDSDGYIRVRTEWQDATAQPIGISLAEVAAILFQPEQMIPLATLKPTQVSGPPQRFRIPPPTATDEEAFLELSPMHFRGPLTARYRLPENATRFAAQASLPIESRTWGDYELVVLDDSTEIFRARINQEQPTVDINVELAGSELTLRLEPGARGPIHDHLILDRAVIKVD